MLIKQAMTKKVIATKLGTPIRDVARTMTKYRVGSVVVVDGDKIVGIVTELDIIWKVVASDLNPSMTKVDDIMTKKVVTIEANKSLEDATALMVENKIKKLPVVDKGKLVGIITATDLISVQPKMIEDLAKLLLFEEKKEIAG
jgi:CBS domain-containing protein